MDAARASGGWRSGDADAADAEADADEESAPAPALEPMRRVPTTMAGGMPKRIDGLRAAVGDDGRSSDADKSGDTTTPRLFALSAAAGDADSVAVERVASEPVSCPLPLPLIAVVVIVSCSISVRNDCAARRCVSRHRVAFCTDAGGSLCGRIE